MREFITTILLGFFIGVLLGLFVAYKEIPSYYEKEIFRLKTWNDKLIQQISLVVRVEDKFDKGKK